MQLAVSPTITNTAPLFAWHVDALGGTQQFPLSPMPAYAGLAARIAVLVGDNTN